jgi:hypothetical protein
MNITEIHSAIKSGTTVYWQSLAYTVTIGNFDDELYINGPNGHRIGCEANGRLINSVEADFYTEEKSEPIEIALCTVCSSHGTLTVHPATGEVISRNIEEPESEEGKDLASITEFDVTEWIQKYGEAQLPSQLDILDLGYWYEKNHTTQYEEPAHDWRIETAEIRKENSGKTYMLINH